MISVVVGVISATMTEVDSSDERNVTLKIRGMADKDHLLVVRSTATHSLVKQNFAAHLSQVNGEVSIFL
jgi:hypothetical protein